MSYNNETRELTFRPDSIWTKGKSFYFAIVVNEPGSINVKTVHYAEVKIKGRSPTEIRYEISNLYQPNSLRPLQGEINFTHDIDTTFWFGRVFEMFDIYYRRTENEWSRYKRSIAEDDFLITEYTERQVKFQVSFEINIQTDGVLHIDIRENFDVSQVFLDNPSETRFLNNGTEYEFMSFQLDAQEYLRQHWYNPGSPHGHDYGVEFVSIIDTDPLDVLNNTFSLKGAYKSFREEFDG